MSSRLIEIFEDTKLVNRIKNKLPYLFQLAELESSRAGKIGMEVGSLRERIIIALLIYKFGEANVETNIPTLIPLNHREQNDGRKPSFLRVEQELKE